MARQAAGPLPTLPDVLLGGNEDGRSAGERIAINPHNNSQLLLGTSQNGLWRSRDFSASWSQVDNESFPAGVSSALMFVLYDSHVPGSVYVAVNEASASSLLVSSDGGKSFAPVPGAPADLIPYRCVVEASGASLFCTYSDHVGPNGMTRGKVMRHDKASGNWTVVTPSQWDPEGTRGGFAGISADAKTPGVIMVTSMDRWGPADEIFREKSGKMSIKNNVCPQNIMSCS